MRLPVFFSACLIPGVELYWYVMKSCHACKRELQIARLTGRRDECPFCGADIHCCLNCTFYDRASSKQCREPSSELVKEKDKANFCDYFRFAEAAAKAPAGVEQARKELDDLFKR